jgi:hypothetical protein
VVAPRVTQALARQLRPGSRAYYEIWLDGQKQVSTEAEEPFYGDRYLPRKFKVAVGLSTDNCVDIWAQDVGLLAIVKAGRLQGYNLLVGGGLGMTHIKGDTTARLAEPLGFVPLEHGVEAVRLVAQIFRDHGNRSDRRLSRYISGYRRQNAHTDRRLPCHHAGHDAQGSPADRRIPRNVSGYDAQSAAADRRFPRNISGVSKSPRADRRLPRDLPGYGAQ